MPERIASTRFRAIPGPINGALSYDRADL
jgi:hypothetical protein